MVGEQLDDNIGRWRAARRMLNVLEQSGGWNTKSRQVFNQLADGDWCSLGRRSYRGSGRQQTDGACGFVVIMVSRTLCAMKRRQEPGG